MDQLCTPNVQANDQLLVITGTVPNLNRHLACHAGAIAQYKAAAKDQDNGKNALSPHWTHRSCICCIGTLILKCLFSNSCEGIPQKSAVGILG